MGHIIKPVVPPDIVDTTSLISEGYDWGIKELGEFTSQNINSVLSVLKQDVIHYLGKLDNAYSQFLKVNRLVKQVKSLPKKDDDQSVGVKISSISSSKYNNERKATQDFISVLMEGHELLSYIRMQMTGQSLNTVFTVQSEGKMYTIDSSLIPELYKVVLSTYGGTSGSPFSLAYQLDSKILSEIIEMRKEGVQEISSTDIYNQIMAIKTPYLQEKSKLTGKKYRPVFNSKDAEIYDLMIQSGFQSEWLTLSRYANLRASMGGGGGYRSSSLKLGDVGLQQDKYFSNANNMVNFGRYSLIRNNLLTLSQSLTTNPSTNAQTIINMFTEKRGRITDAVSYITNQAAREHIQSLFGV